MDALQRARLRIVPISSVRPHEITDAVREQRIERRLQADGVLRDPLLVGELPGVDDYVLLDGTNRLQALQNLDCYLALVQILDYNDPNQVRLLSWCHRVAMPGDAILAHVRSMAGVHVFPIPPREVPSGLRESDTLAVLVARGGAYLMRRDQTLPHAEQLCRLVEFYEPRMERADCDPDDVADVGAGLPESTSQLAFPYFSTAQVAAIALYGPRIPAGITRHVILSGRALRVNVELPILRLDAEEGNEALQRHLAALHPRVYREPTILFDS